MREKKYIYQRVLCSAIDVRKFTWIARQTQRDAADQRVDRNVNDETDDDFPPILELLLVALLKEASVAEPLGPLFPLSASQ